MSRRPKPAPPPLVKLAKCPTGIHGLDVITGGGLPRGRPTLVCGGAGSGKTLIGMEFLIRGIQQHGENGAFMSFEERATDLAENVASLGYDLTALTADKKLVIDQVQIDRGEIMETGEYDLDGLFIRLAAAIDAVGAKRVVLDTIETLFAALTNTHIIRSELRRLFGWLKEKGVTAIITGERGDGTLTRHGLEEYVSDCVISLDQRVIDQIATRRLRVVKYRGSAHGTNEYPFLIDEQGITVLPITAIDLNYPASRDVVSTGIPKLDSMLGGEGYFRGGSLLVSGTAGTGKSSIAAHFADAACRRGEQCIYFAFEESPDQIVRNMRSIGIDLGSWVEKGLLHFAAFRPSRVRTGGASQHDAEADRRDQAADRHRGPGVQLHGSRNRQRCQVDADAHDRSAEDTADHRADDQPDGWRTRGRAKRGRHFIADRLLGDVAQSGAGGRAHPHAVDHQVARHEAFQSGAGACAERSWRRSGGGFHRAGWRHPDRVAPSGPGNRRSCRRRGTGR